MDVSLFQFSVAGASDSSEIHGIFDAQPAARFAQGAGKPVLMQKLTASSANLDFLRSFAVLLVVGFHLAKFFNWRFGNLRVTDFGLLGVMLFFVHTTLVLMFSLERQSAGRGASLFVPFMIRRCFRIYPLAILVVTFAYLLRIPSDL
jgi:peptidoglycan/LPS O-acetylase OafA/YrhL